MAQILGGSSPSGPMESAPLAGVENTEHYSQPFEVQWYQTVIF